MIFLGAVIAIAVTMLLALVRALLGPSVYDRVLAVNMFGTKTVLLLAVVAFVADRSDYLDLALAYALISHEVSEAQEIVDDFRECSALVIPNSEPMQIWISRGAEKTFLIDPALAGAVQPMSPGPKTAAEE